MQQNTGEVLLKPSSILGLTISYRSYTLYEKNVLKNHKPERITLTNTILKCHPEGHLVTKNYC
jgi:hypothetical protein